MKGVMPEVGLLDVKQFKEEQLKREYRREENQIQGEIQEPTGQLKKTAGIFLPWNEKNIPKSR